MTEIHESVRVDELMDVLGQGVRLLRHVYASQSDFAHQAQMWVLSAEAVLDTRTCWESKRGPNCRTLDGRPNWCVVHGARP